MTNYKSIRTRQLLDTGLIIQQRNIVNLRSIDTYIRRGRKETIIDINNC